MSKTCPKCGAAQAGRVGSYLCGTYRPYVSDDGPLRISDSLVYTRECELSARIAALEAQLAEREAEGERLRGFLRELSRDRNFKLYIHDHYQEFIAVTLAPNADPQEGAK